MSQVKVEWLQRVNGRWPGAVENLERTPYIDALVAQRRVRILDVAPEPEYIPAPIVGVFIPALSDSLVEADVFDHIVDDGGDLSHEDDVPPPSEPVTTEAESLSESELLGLAVPKPKPRAPRKPKAEDVVQ